MGNNNMWQNINNWRLWNMGQVLTKSKTVTELLNKQVANWSVLYMKLHNFHWFVRGESFFTLHVKFEELYTEAALNFDAIAERILTLHGKPVASLKETLTLSSIKEAANNENAEQMVRQLIQDYQLVAQELTEGIELAEQDKDQPSADMMIAIRQTIEKHTWMFQAYLGK